MIFASEKTTSQKRLLLISDLWGWRSSSILSKYLEVLSKDYSIVVCDSCAMAGIDSSGASEQEIHQQFVNGGIEKASHYLLENHREETIDILAFSVGATIAWKAMLVGLKVDRFFGVSGTRLRYEIEKPNARIELLFGDRDRFKPAKEWFTGLEIRQQLIKGAGHDLYEKEQWLGDVFEWLLE